MRYGVYTMIQLGYNEYKSELVKAFDDIEDAYRYSEDNPYWYVAPIEEAI